jgi:hypothetical protein
MEGSGANYQPSEGAQCAQSISPTPEKGDVRPSSPMCARSQTVWFVSAIFSMRFRPEQDATLLESLPRQGRRASGGDDAPVTGRPPCTLGRLAVCQRNEQKPIKPSEKLIYSIRSRPTVHHRIRGKNHARTSTKPPCGKSKRLPRSINPYWIAIMRRRPEA